MMHSVLPSVAHIHAEHGSAIKQPARGEAGFTLVEVLIAMALTTLILASILAAFGLARRSWDGLDALEHRGSTAAVRDFLDETLARAEPVQLLGPDGRPRVPFSGSSDHVSFVVNMRGHGMLGGLHVFDIHVEQEADTGSGPAERRRSGDLIIEQTMFRPGATNGPPSQHRVLMRGVQGLTLRYFGSASPDAEPGWHDTWSGSLPRLISYEITRAAKGERPATATVELKLAP